MAFGVGQTRLWNPCVAAHWLCDSSFPLYPWGRHGGPCATLGEASTPCEVRCTAGAAIITLQVSARKCRPCKGFLWRGNKLLQPRWLDTAESDTLMVAEARRLTSGASRAVCPAGALEARLFLASFSSWRRPAFLGGLRLVAVSLRPPPVFTSPSLCVSHLPGHPLIRILLIVVRDHPDDSG